jgi:hypothetical protein
MPPRAATVMPLVRPASVTRLPQRPDPSILSDAIPLFFIGQNREEFWVARDADGRVGGIFLRKQSALKFADRNAPPVGCAKMFLSGRFELDIESKGNPRFGCLCRMSWAARWCHRCNWRPRCRTRSAGALRRAWKPWRRHWRASIS